MGLRAYCTGASREDDAPRAGASQRYRDVGYSGEIREITYDGMGLKASEIVRKLKRRSNCKTTQRTPV